MSDGPMGVRAEFEDDAWINAGKTEDYVTYLPCNSALASTWNRGLAEVTGEVLGEEARGRGKDVILAPGINIKRSPICGRNFEYMSEDPYLTAQMTVPFVKGVQRQDVAACVKHFAANSQETERLLVDMEVSERALREIYFPGFQAAVEKGGIFALMGAYNKVNGEHCCTGKNLMNRVLRDEWKYDGVVVSDWGAVHDTVEAAESGLDIEMDVTDRFEEHYMARPLLEKVKSGEVDEALINEKVRNILRLMLRLHMIGENRESRKSGAYNTQEHRQAALDVARESIILLKNEEHLLPLYENNIKKIAVIGRNAVTQHANGGGSAEIKALYEITPFMGLKKLLGGNVKVSYAPGYVIPEKEDKKSYLQEACELAKNSDVVIFVGGLSHEEDVEGQDRTSMKLPYGQDEVITELLRVRPDMIVVMYAGSAVEMPWKDQAKAILWSYYAGMEGGTALAEILFGRVNPSAKLAETFPADISQCSAHSIGTFGKRDKVSFAEGVMVGYRHYDTRNLPVSFCMGHGLSYSTFDYSNLRVKEIFCSGKISYRISICLENRSDLSGQEVVQFYIAPPASDVERPCHELKEFVKIRLHPKEKKQVTVHLDQDAFTYYSEKENKFVLDEGVYEIQVGASSRDIRLREKISVHSTKSTEM
jgi:beta-glucosidase